MKKLNIVKERIYKSIDDWIEKNNIKELSRRAFYDEMHDIYTKSNSQYRDGSCLVDLPYGNKSVATLSKSNQLLIDIINSKQPFMVGRLGETELRTLICYLSREFPVRNILTKRQIKHIDCANLFDGAGFFPEDINLIPQFAEEYFRACENVDLLAAWFNRYEDFIFDEYMKKAQAIRFAAYEVFRELPYVPWTKALEGKRVLVISPFAESIQKQYEKRDKLFKNPDILPQFELMTIKAPQSPRITGEKSTYASWFDALEWLHNETRKFDFDVALLGCGAYGFPLASRIKSDGHGAIHFCGKLQLLFGVKGSRWSHYGIYNEYWVSPSDKETPKNISAVEGGCYW